MATMVALSKISIPSNVRLIDGVVDLKETPLSDFPEEERNKILDLANSIKEYGLLQPLVVKDLGKGKSYRLIAGYRRFKALQHNGSKSADVKSVKGKTEDEIVLKLIENIHRDDLNPYEIAMSLDAIRKQKNVTKQTSLARLVNKSQGWVSQHLSILKMDEGVQKMVAVGDVGLSAAREFSTVPKEEQAEVLSAAKKDQEKDGKTKVSVKAARRQTSRKKSEKAEKQGVIRPLKEREEEQKTLVCEGFLNERFEGEDIPSELRQLVYEFWDALMAKNRLYIFK